MEKRLYVEKRFLLMPIKKPKKTSIFDHVVLFVNDSDNTIEKAIPDFDERYMDSKSSNTNKINENTYLSYFKIIDHKSNFLPSNKPIFEVTICEGQANDPTKYVGPKVISARCINFYTITIEDVILDGLNSIKTKII